MMHSIPQFMSIAHFPNLFVLLSSCPLNPLRYPFQVAIARLHHLIWLSQVYLGVLTQNSNLMRQHFPISASTNTAAHPDATGIGMRLGNLSSTLQTPQNTCASSAQYLLDVLTLAPTGMPGVA
jgi:hypothetical protein